MATVSKQWIIACWIIYVGYWIVSARGTKAAAERQSWPAMLAYRSPLLAGGTLLWLTTVPHPLSLALTPHTDLARAVAVVVCALGLSIAIWSRRTLGRNWSSEVTFKQGHELITAGRTASRGIRSIRAFSYCVWEQPSRPASLAPGSGFCSCAPVFGSNSSRRNRSCCGIFPRNILFTEGG